MASDLNDEKTCVFGWQQRDTIEQRILLVKCSLDYLGILFHGEING